MPAEYKWVFLSHFFFFFGEGVPIVTEMTPNYDPIPFFPALGKKGPLKMGEEGKGTGPLCYYQGFFSLLCVEGEGGPACGLIFFFWCNIKTL